MSVTTLNEGIASQFIELRIPKEIDFSAKELPNAYIWDPPEDTHQHYPVIEESVPTIELSNPDDTAVLRQIRDACETRGLFLVTGHGVPMDVIRRCELECKRLFDLQSHQKMSVARKPGALAGYGSFLLSKHFSKSFWSESFYVFETPVEAAKKLWPDDYRTFCDAIEEYKGEMKKLGTRLTGLILTTLGCSIEDEDIPGFEDSSPFTGLNSYPVCPEPEKAMGIAPHKDSSMITILHQTTGGGLQFHRGKDDDIGGGSEDKLGVDRWVPVPKIGDALIVNLGDVFQICSNGRYCSVLHRVVASQTIHRHAMTYFHSPLVDSKIGPLKKAMDEGERPKYKELKWVDYMGIKARVSTKALDSITIEE